MRLCCEFSLNMTTIKRCGLSASDKSELLKKFDELPVMTQAQAAAKLQISQPTLCKLLQNREKIARLSSDSNVNKNRKRKRCGKDEDVETALKEWFTCVREKDARVNGPLLKMKAEQLAQRMGKQDFVATDGWFRRWVARENIMYCKPVGEQGEADGVAANVWIRDEWPKIIADYSPSQIYNADETGLYYRALPEHTFVFKDKKVKGVKACKERVTVLCCVSMSGQKRPLLVIGKSRNPRCFKGVKKLPTQYRANTNAWMTSSIFSEWLCDWDAELTENILLLVDNCTAHVMNPQLKHIKVVFLPANTTSILQPCDQGIIRTAKAYYRREMRLRIIQVIDEQLTVDGAQSGEFRANEIAKKTSLLDALHLLVRAWNSVSTSTIENCFRKGGFSVTESSVEEEDDFPIFDDIPKAVFEEWMAIDDRLQTSYIPSEEELCSRIMNRDTEEDMSDDDEVVLQPVPTCREMLHALDILRRGVQHYGDDFQLQYKYENYISTIICNVPKQTKIDNFFPKLT